MYIYICVCIYMWRTPQKACHSHNGVPGMLRRGGPTLLVWPTSRLPWYKFWYKFGNAHNLHRGSLCFSAEKTLTLPFPIFLVRPHSVSISFFDLWQEVRNTWFRDYQGYSGGFRWIPIIYIYIYWYIYWYILILIYIYIDIYIYILILIYIYIYIDIYIYT